MTGITKNQAIAEAAIPEEAATPAEEAIQAAEAVIPVAEAIHHLTHLEQELLMEDHPEEQVLEDIKKLLINIKTRFYMKSGFFNLQSLFSSFYDVILGLSGKHIEECAVTRHSDDQVFMIFRMNLSIKKSITRDYVVLYMVSMQSVEECSQQHFQLLLVFF